MLRNLLKAKRESGFTIIEVMIVLAIAGIILVVVLVAVPQLQRNQRNEARRNVASRIATEVNNFASNNNGNLPTASLTAGVNNFGTPAVSNSFFGRYLGCNGTTCSANIDDPRTGTPVGTGTDGGSNLTTTVFSGTTSSLGNTPGSIAYSTGNVCDGESVVAGSARNFVFQLRLEGGAIACLDNK